MEKQEMEQLNKDIKPAEEPQDISQMTELEKKQMFLQEYTALVKKCGYDFYQPPPDIIKINFQPPPKKDDSK